jgi:DNA-binding transcriptional ArsR family regulator
MSDRIARAERAETAYREFIEPMIDELRNVYSERIVELAITELSRDKRADKITALSNALKILTTLDSGMLEMIRDGDLARRDKLKTERVENMTAPARRLFNIAGY